jgi:hypothetical protein
MQGGRRGGRGREGGRATVDDRHPFQDAVEREFSHEGGGGRGGGRVILEEASLARENGEGNFLWWGEEGEKGVRRRGSERGKRHVEGGR